MNPLHAFVNEWRVPLDLGAGISSFFDVFSVGSQDGQSVRYLSDSRFYWDSVPSNNGAFPSVTVAVKTFVVSKKLPL